MPDVLPATTDVVPPPMCPPLKANNGKAEQHPHARGASEGFHLGLTQVRVLPPCAGANWGIPQLVSVRPHPSRARSRGN